MRANDALLHVLRQLASRQSIHCGPDQGRGVVRRGGCSSGGGLTGFAGVAWISMGRLSRSSPKSLSLSFSFFSFTNAFASCSSIGGRTSVVSCRCRVFFVAVAVICGIVLFVSLCIACVLFLQGCHRRPYLPLFFSWQQCSQ